MDPQPKLDALSKSESKPDPNDTAEKSASPPARLPLPSLFQGPPSRNTSNLSLHLPAIAAAAIGLPSPSLTAAATGPLRPTRSQILPRKTYDLETTSLSGIATAAATEQGSAGGNINISTPPRPTPQRYPTNTFSRQTSDAIARRENEEDRADALWAEMQTTLAEVELSAANGSHVFGQGHTKALEELRTAQLGLARAWATGEREDGEERKQKESEKEELKRGGHGDKDGFGETDKQGVGDGLGAQRLRGQTDPRTRRPGAENDEETVPNPQTLEEETENDILLAKRRREANDRYFEQVNSAVVDVVAKLDEVASAMRKVERESRDIWSDEEEEGQDGSEGTSTSSVSG